MTGYIDPGAGGLLMQLLVGGVAGAAVLVRMRWRRLRRFFGLTDREAERESAGE